MRKPRVTRPAEKLDECACCGRPLKGTVAMLELDQRTWTYHDLGGIPADKSQGWFPFGMSCARGELLKHSKTNRSVSVDMEDDYADRAEWRASR